MPFADKIYFQEVYFRVNFHQGRLGTSVKPIAAFAPDISLEEVSRDISSKLYISFSNISSYIRWNYKDSSQLLLKTQTAERDNSCFSKTSSFSDHIKSNAGQQAIDQLP